MSIHDIYDFILMDVVINKQAVTGEAVSLHRIPKGCERERPEKADFYSS
ncbi:MAG: hypothetical protein JW864_00515 [Spirochaetes bacterium]|nr:hypothetical protein [Spirochaetota bacterium]